MGRIATSTLPMLVLGLRRDGFQGWLRLTRGGTRRDFQFVAGRLIRVESNDAGDALAPVLRQLGSLSEDETQSVGDAVTSGTPELRAIAALRKVTPKDLLAGVSEQARQALVESLGWPDGEFTLEPEGSGGTASPGAIDVLPLVLDAAARRVEPHHVLEILGENATRFPSVTESEHTDAGKVVLAHPWVASLLEGIDGRTAPFHLLRAETPEKAAAALLALEASGLLSWSEEAAAAPEDPDADTAAAAAAEDPADSLLDAIEIEVIQAPAAAESVTDAAAVAAPGARGEKAEELVGTIRDLHDRLGEIDHYALLGIESDAKPAAIRRAYLKLAKRLHPDAVARLGVDEVLGEANAVFARISEAHETLTDADDRERYDAKLRGDEEIDFEKVAQAEALYQKGDMLMRAGNFLGALDLLEAATELYPVEADYQGAYGWCLFKKNPPEAEKAHLHLTEAARLDSSSAVWPFRLHYVLRHLGDEAGARTALATAKRIDPDIA